MRTAPLSAAAVQPTAGAGVPDSHVAARSWEALFRAQVALMRRFSAEDIWEPVTVREYDVLFTLSQAPQDGLRLHELNTDVLISQPSLSRMVDRLEAQGLVTKKPSASDRRGLLITLTPAGARLQKTIGRKHVESIRAYVEPALTLDELRTLEQLCTKLRTAQASIETRDTTPHASAESEERAS
ncbi:MarR family transcriptional regulator [Sanguibacter sp. 25GB23B1]|uniref:MarR family winged helix-turn-helix transcriptional regulator n=1 Tax=unclassified Sanguibacter TaxID=2645534 RepID=UPI0032AE9A22